MMPNYLVSMGDDAVVLRNYEGLLIRYQAEDKPATGERTITRGVSSLLQGTRSALIPAGNERMARRRKSKAKAPAKKPGKAKAGDATPQALPVSLPVISSSNAAGYPNGVGR